VDGLRQLWQSFLVLFVECKLNDGQVEAIDKERWQLRDACGTGRLTGVQDLAD